MIMATRKLTYQYQATSVGTLSTPQTFTAVPFGRTDTTRRIYVVVTTASNTIAATISSVTIGGVTATLTILKTSSFGNPGIYAIAYANVPTGTSGNIVVTVSATPSIGFNIHTYSVYDQQTPLASGIYASSFSSFLSTTTISPTATLTQNGGFAITNIGYTSNTTPTLTGGTKDTTGAQLNSAGSTYTYGSDTAFTWTWTADGSKAGGVTSISIAK